MTRASVLTCCLCQADAEDALDASQLFNIRNVELGLEQALDLVFQRNMSQRREAELTSRPQSDLINHSRPDPARSGHPSRRLSDQPLPSRIVRLTWLTMQI